MPKAKPSYARVLTDVPAFNLKPNHLAMGSAAAIAALHLQGFVDPSDGAIEYAKSQGAEVIEVGEVDIDLDTTATLAAEAADKAVLAAAEAAAEADRLKAAAEAAAAAAAAAREPDAVA